MASWYAAGGSNYVGVGVTSEARSGRIVHRPITQLAILYPTHRADRLESPCLLLKYFLAFVSSASDQPAAGCGASSPCVGTSSSKNNLPSTLINQ